MKKRALLVMAKRPSPGRTKTRLCPPLSGEQAAALYECFLRDVLSLARAIPNITPCIAFAPRQEKAYFRQLAPDFKLVPQRGATLGERLDAVLSHCLHSGFAQAVALSSDNPDLPASYVAQAFARLDDKNVDVVLGPCEDGGYYLIGWKRPFPRLVREVQMSTPRVLQDTLAIAQEENLRVSLLPSWYDVDEVEDLARLAEGIKRFPGRGHHTQAFLQEIMERGVGR